jgi:hypothetical protein
VHAVREPERHSEAVVTPRCAPARRRTDTPPPSAYAMRDRCALELQAMARRAAEQGAGDAVVDALERAALLLASLEVEA